MSKSALTSLVSLVVVVIAVIVVLLFVPTKNSNSNNSNKTKIASNNLSSSQKSLDTKTIENNIKLFFAANTSLSERESLLQNGSQFAKVMQSDLAQLNSQKPSVSITNITFPNKTTAKIIYNVQLNGQTVLKNQTGESLDINNKWVVSDSTLCQLLSLGGNAPSACTNIH